MDLFSLENIPHDDVVYATELVLLGVHLFNQSIIQNLDGGVGGKTESYEKQWIPENVKCIIN